MAFLRRNWLVLIFATLTIVMAILTWSLYGAVAARYQELKVIENRAGAASNTFDPAALALLVTRTPTPIPPTATATPTSTPTATPALTSTPSPTPQVLLWTGAAHLIIDEKYPDLDFAIKDPKRAFATITRAFLEAFAAWEMTRIYSNRSLVVDPLYDRPFNTKFSLTQTDMNTWVTDQALRPYNQFGSIPAAALNTFQQSVRNTSRRGSFQTTRVSYFSQGFQYPPNARLASQAYATYLEQYLLTNNGVLGDVVLFGIDDTFTMEKAPTGVNMQLFEPADLDLKKGIVIRLISNPAPAIRPILSGGEGFRYLIENNTLVIEIYSTTRSGDELSSLIHLALEILGRAGNSASFNRMSSAYTVVQDFERAIVRYGSQGVAVPESGFLEARPFPPDEAVP